MKRQYITTTLPYVNAPLHIGHALEFIRADALARYYKTQGIEVFFNTGTDEHGQKIYTKALEGGLSAQVFVDAGFQTFKEQVQSFGFSDDAHFIRTSDEKHILSAQAFWKLVDERGYIYKKNYEAKYCVGCEAEKTDSELVNGECPDHPGKKLEIINEENYFFKLSALQNELLSFYEKNPSFITPSFRYNEIKAFVERGLEDFSISRLKEKMSWGVPVSGDENHVMYVWFDALTNYISTLGWPNDTETFENFWVNGNPIQYCGKDNTRFQGLTWQAMLIAAGLPNTKHIVVNGHITADGGIKMSKSLGNVVDPLMISKEYGVDALRYFLLAEISSFEDSPFTIERFNDAYTAGLVNGIGNLTARIMTLAEKHLEGPVSLPTETISIASHMDAFDIQGALKEIVRVSAELDKEIQITQPFKVIKEDAELGKALITKNVQTLYTIAQALIPFMPHTGELIMNAVLENKKPENLFVRK
jgi:methionyl-tRNA synthetase